jgi:hypothetical protein
VSTISGLIEQFEPISLKEMDGVKLQDRVDTKYVLGTRDLPEVFEQMLADYRLLEVNGERGTHYRTLYYDTAGLKHYKDHHNKRTFRAKVRFREYLGSGLTFLEVKRKTGRGRTDKKRMKVDAISTSLSEEQSRFVVKARGGNEPLLPTIWNQFTRYTFVNRHKPERLTIDVALTFADDTEQRELGDIVVAEVKQERADRTSKFIRIMRSMELRPSSLSKYCVGMLLMGKPVKHNAFKEVLLKLQHIREAA